MLSVFRLRIKEKTYNWLTLPFTLPMFVEDALSSVKRFLVQIMYTLDSITQMRIRFQISTLLSRALKNQSTIYFFSSVFLLNAVRVDQAAQGLSILEAKRWKQSSSHIIIEVAYPLKY